MGKADWDTQHPGWVLAADIGRSVRLEWGGKKLKDLPHFQYTCGLELSACRELFDGGGLPAVWVRVH